MKWELTWSVLLWEDTKFSQTTVSLWEHGRRAGGTRTPSQPEHWDTSKGSDLTGWSIWYSKLSLSPKKEQIWQVARLHHDVTCSLDNQGIISLWNFWRLSLGHTSCSSKHTYKLHRKSHLPLMTGSQHSKLVLSDSRHNGDCHLT